MCNTVDKDTRTEKDSLGEFAVPADAKYGVHTARARANFQMTMLQLRHFPDLVNALTMVKKAAAITNRNLGVLNDVKADAICRACDQILKGEHHDHFVVDMIQGGAGTSTNMNANEVIANLGLELMGYTAGDYRQLHPNDHVNRSQSTNDVYPTAMRMAIIVAAEPLVGALESLVAAFRQKAEEFSHIRKVGRTQMQDAVPITLGQEFASYAATFVDDIKQVRETTLHLHKVNLGGTAIGTGTNTPEGYSELVIDELSRISGRPMKRATDLIEASWELGDVVMFSGTLKRIATKISKVCNDLRLLSSGPRAGFGEISLPPVQAGSSIMPGKVNPVIPEVVNQVAYEVIGNDVTVTMASEAGQLQLNAMEPVILKNVLQSCRMLTNAFEHLTNRCVLGIQANEDRCAELLSGSLVHAVNLVHRIGYERAAAVSKHALVNQQTLKQSLGDLEGITEAEASGWLCDSNVWQSDVGDL